jgi:glyoxylase-like metal-dependent hydrolase (beta-lactamase superfamily II)
MSAPAVHRIPVPNPFFEGKTNVYLVDAEPLTLVDAGIGTEEAYQALQSGLSEVRCSAADVKRIVLTHHHLDHFGLAWRMQSAFGAQVFVHAAELDAVASYEAWHDRFLVRLQKTLAEWSVPAARMDEVTSLLASGGRHLGRSVNAAPLLDGDVFEMGYTRLEVIHTPGHSAGSVCLRMDDCLFSGDHVLPRISPNIGGGELGGGGELSRYLDSLRRVRAFAGEIQLVYPGHGEPFPELGQRVDELLRHHREREEQVVRLLHERGAMTVFEAATALFGELRGYHVILGAAEALAHLDKLVEEQRIRQEMGRFAVN